METISIGRQHFRVRPWHSDPTIAHISTSPNAAPISAVELRSCLEKIKRKGFTAALTSAVASEEAEVYLEMGFRERDRLRVLRHPISPDMPEVSETEDSSEVRYRRAKRSDKTACLEVDGKSFNPFWRLDAAGLQDAEEATPTRRFRVAELHQRIAGYAVTGRGGNQGFIQRLATDPDFQRRGIASALVVDSLRWCQKRGVSEVYVNTQVSNTAALRLYEKLGFVTTPSDLVVLLWSGD